MTLPSQAQDWITIFLGILVEATPFLLLGVLISAVVHVFVSEDRLLRLVPRNPVLSLIPALGIGMLMPVCECGNVAVARRFLAKGVPVSTCITFLLAAPILNPVALFATATAFRYEPSVVWWRGGLAFVVAAAVGGMIGYWGKGEELLASGLGRASHHHPDHGHDHQRIAVEPLPQTPSSGLVVRGSFTAHSGLRGAGPTWLIARVRATSAKLNRVAGQAGSEFMTMMQVLVLGAAIASATQVFIPRATFTDLGAGIVLSIVAMMSLAFVLSICSTVDAFFALSYSNIFPIPALVAFLVFGPMISMKSVGMLLTAFRPRVVVALVAVTVELVFLAALLMNLRGVTL